MEIVYINYSNIIVPKKLPKYAESPVLYGSSLNRLYNQKRHEKKQILLEGKEPNKPIKKDKFLSVVDATPLPEKEIKQRSLSPRSKIKIKNKLAAWFAASDPKNFTFVTLSFIDKVDDKKAVKILNNWLTEQRKTKGKFDYLWVIERQENGNPHFHIANTMYWDINEANESWIHYQLQKGLYNDNLKRGPKFHKKTKKPFINKNTGTNEWYLLNPFDVDKVRSQSSLGSYITKYVTKNTQNFGSAVWGCSRSISNLFTGYLGNSTDYWNVVGNSAALTYFDSNTNSSCLTKLCETEYSISQKIANVEPILFKYDYVKSVNQKILNKSLPVNNQVEKMRFIQRVPKHLFSVYHHICFVSSLYVKNQTNTQVKSAANKSAESGQGGKLLNTLDRWKKIGLNIELSDAERQILKNGFNYNYR